MDHVDRRMAVDRERGFIYFRIPKAANSTICYRLARQKDPTIDNADDAKRSFLRGRDLTWDEVKHLNDRFYLFTFVRNPYSRIASAYLDKVERMKPKQQKVLSSLQEDEGTPPTFLEFCRYLDRGGLYDDPHWFPQTWFFASGVSSLDYVGFVDNLEEGYSAVSKVLSFASRESEMTWDPHRTGASAQVVDLFCDNTKEIIARVYTSDFVEFGFSFDL